MKNLHKNDFFFVFAIVSLILFFFACLYKYNSKIIEQFPSVSHGKEITFEGYMQVFETIPNSDLYSRKDYDKCKITTSIPNKEYLLGAFDSRTSKIALVNYKAICQNETIEVNKIAETGKIAFVFVKKEEFEKMKNEY